MLQNYIEEFIKGYKVCALWSSSHIEDDEDNEGTPFDQLDPEPEWSEEALTAVKEDCEAFCTDQESDLLDYMLERVYNLADRTTLAHAGHDFWLTRCGHGAGFWDRGLGELGDRLTKACEPYGNVDLYLGDDGKIYLG
jgi:hypothetical protein